MHTETHEKPLNAIVASVQLPTVSDSEFEASLNELRELAKTLGFKVVQTFIQKRSGFDTTAYMGVGKPFWSITKFPPRKPAIWSWMSVAR